VKNAMVRSFHELRLLFRYSKHPFVSEVQDMATLAVVGYSCHLCSCGNRIPA